MSPIYQFVCEDCCNTFDMHLPVSKRDAPTKGYCHLCDGQIKRVVGCAGFQLKGGGWASTGYSKTLGNIIKKSGDIYKSE